MKRIAGEKQRAFAFMVLFLLSFSSAAQAVMPDEILKDRVLESRARDIGQNLRCLVCQNQSIDDSDAPLARDLRLILRERLSRGDSNEQVIAYVVQRYGNYVLLKPPFQANTALLWLLPYMLLLVGLGLAWSYLRQQPEARDGEGDRK